MKVSQYPHVHEALLALWRYDGLPPFDVVPIRWTQAFADAEREARHLSSKQLEEMATGGERQLQLTSRRALWALQYVLHYAFYEVIT